MMRNKSVSAHSFAMVPRADIPRAAFKMEHALKTTFNAGDLVPIYLQEMLPGDTFNVSMHGVARLATPLVPVMDNLHMETFFFACPWRLLWENFERFMGAQTDPDDSTDYVIPQVEVPENGFASLSIADYFGLPVGTTIAPEPIVATINRLPFEMYNLVWNEWFRDENLQDSRELDKTDATLPWLQQYEILPRGKRKDYITGALPWPQKGEAVPLPLGTTAPIYGRGDAGYPMAIGVQESFVSGGTPNLLQVVSGNTGVNLLTNASESASLTFTATEQPLYADLTEAAGSTINALRQSFQIQRLLERDARGGTRYTEMVLAHFGVRPPDFRLQRPEYIGGGHAAIHINPVAQTSATSAEGTDTPQGSLAAIGTAVIRNGFTYSAQEHMYVMGLVNVRADITYQQGLNRLWSRRTRFDVYHPVFAALGEQAIYRKEVMFTGIPGHNDDDFVFGYQERWAEYRYEQSQITGLFRSLVTLGYTSIDIWHYAEEFEDPPVLNGDFIVDKSRFTVDRSTAVGPEADGQQLILDCVFTNRAARPMPLYSVPGLIDHF